ncbi:uncharacterized protein LOC131669904 [Phymastichus coffea]|uniref:uncharacterized protein LOC131669904 n=1 Tax=Phymastichus coffea TaxID=108790 RepID=UPI00273CC967|nr:uncharacterized protein LOC131669904 [Phymastichus coffea]
MAKGPQEMGEDMFKKINKIVDIPFTEKILRESERDANLKVLSVFIKPATNKGDNYTSDMFRATVEYTRQEDKKTINQTKSLIVKVEPLTEGVHQDLISKSSLFSTEILMMTDTLARMNELLGPDSPPLNGRGLYTQSKNPPLLVIEDLAPLGFRMADRQAGLDMDHCLLAIRNLARFHASSIALMERDPSQRTKYSRGIFHESQPAEMQIFFEQGTQQLGKEIANWPELDPEISKKILKLASTIYKKGCEVTAFRENEFNVLNHGDFWVNNMLFQYNESNKPIGHIFVDFQVCLYSSPGVDLNYFFNTSLTDDTLVLHEETLIIEYTRVLASAMAQVNCAIKPPSLEEVKAMIRDRALYGMIAAINILPLMLVNKEEVNDLNEILSKGENLAYKGKLYRKAMVRRLPKFHQMGLLD